jgi:2,3-bisphosphoglycerate-independent phosphoglycerate mutase
VKPVILIVLDGYGVAPPNFGNAIHLANPTNLNSFLYSYPNTTLRASGESVGLPAGEVGNTEVGHINLGAGRIVYQDLPRINLSIADGSFFKNPQFLKVISHLNTTGGKLHLLGLVGQGSVHSNLDHLIALVYFAKEYGLQKVFIHAITDGRDSPPKSASEII